LAEITGVLKSTTAHVTLQQEKLQMDGHYDMPTMELHKNGSVKVRIQMLKRPQSVILYCNWTGCKCQWSNAEKQVRGVSHNDFKATDGYLHENAGLV
jgi:hypothetical protein